LAAGSSPGTLTIGDSGVGDLQLLDTSTLKTELGDLVAVEGAVTIATGAELALAETLGAWVTDVSDTRGGQQTDIVLQGANVSGTFGAKIPVPGAYAGSGQFAGTPTHDGGGFLTGFVGPVVTENAANVELTAFQAMGGDANLDGDVDIADNGSGDAEILVGNLGKTFTAAAGAALGAALAAEPVDPLLVTGIYYEATGNVTVDISAGGSVQVLSVLSAGNMITDPNDGGLLMGFIPPGQADGNVVAWLTSFPIPVGFHDLGNIVIPPTPGGEVNANYSVAGVGTFPIALTVVPVPEPGTLLLLLTGFGSLLLWRRR
jgi:hypothetical protein